MDRIPSIFLLLSLLLGLSVLATSSQNESARELKLVVLDDGCPRQLSNGGGPEALSVRCSNLDSTAGTAEHATLLYRALEHGAHRLNISATTIEFVDIVGPTGSITAEDMAKGINWAIEQRAHVVNISYTLHYNPPELDEALNRAHESGIALYASAANITAGSPSFPADHRSVTRVGIGPHDTCARYSLTLSGSTVADLSGTTPSTSVASLLGSLLHFSELLNPTCASCTTAPPRITGAPDATDQLQQPHHHNATPKSCATPLRRSP